MKNGSINSSVLFVAEAPGRLGANLSGIPLTGDQTGRNFDVLLRAAELKRSDIFITNAVLCNPRDAQGYNAPPTQQEIENCTDHLHETIHLLQPRCVAGLGACDSDVFATWYRAPYKYVDELKKVAPEL